MARLSAYGLLLATASAFALPGVAHAQSLAYGDVSQGADEPSDGSSSSGGSSSRRSRGSDKPPPTRTRDITPYIEVAQVVRAELSPQDEVLTYTKVAAGVDSVLAGRNSAAAVSVRYERNFSWQDSRGDEDYISGIARGVVSLSPGVSIQAGGLATRFNIDDQGRAVDGAVAVQDTVSQVYSVYAGPSVQAQAGDVAIDAHYRIGYTEVDNTNGFAVDDQGKAFDQFDNSVVHVASVTAGVKPDTVLPVGVGVGGTYYREDVNELDQRVEDGEVHAIVTVPVAQSLAVTGAVGYETVEISHRDAVRDADGDPIVGSDGNYVSDKSQPRLLAYDVDGLTWDAGVIWRPSRRTSLTAHVGRRYGTTSYDAVLTYAPSTRSALAVVVYDNIAGFGGQINRALADLPTDFTAIRNPITGDISGCVSSLESGNCLNGSLGSLRSSTFRARGVAASYTQKFGRIKAGLGAGYDRRRFIAAEGTVLEAFNGLIDEKYWLTGYLDAELGQNAGFSAYLYANWIESGGTLGGEANSLGAYGSYYHRLTNHISARATVGIDGYDTNDLTEDIWTMSGLVGVKYSF